ncbi:MAG: hypothetical protein QG639_244, partial [Patescibacteria group bacterium]|nr:hypothetical protein [Patescibacteria group bacterium]
MKSLLVTVWLILIILATSWFFFQPGMFYVHDYLHSARIAEMTRGLQDGHFPVRWSGHFGYGYGMPLFEFYAPLPFYVGAVLTMVGVPLLLATKLLFILCNVLTTVGSYMLGKSIYGRVGGLITAAAISLAPYRAVNLYVRGALSESWGIMAIVWILYSIYLTAKGSKYSWVGLVVSLSVLFLSHNLLTLIFVPFSVVIGLITLLYVHFSNRQKWSTFLQKTALFIFSYILAVGISALYLFPAYFEKSFTQVENIIIGGYFDYSLHFVYLRQFFSPNWGYGGSNWGPEDGISFFLGYAQLITVTVSVLSLLFVGKQLLLRLKQDFSKPRWWWFVSILVLLTVSLLLSTEKTSFIWKALPVMSFVQFPWRFLSVAIVLIGIISPFFLLIQQSFIKRWLLGWFFFLLFFTNAQYFKPENFLDTPDQYFTGDATVIENQLSEVLPDYLPSSAVQIVPPASLASCSAECTITETIKSLTHYKELTVLANGDSTLTFSVNDFPGWFATVDAAPVDIEQQSGLIQVSLTPGEHTVVLEFGSTRLLTVSDILSLGSL